MNISNTALINIGLGSVLGPFVGILAYYVAIKNLEVGRVSLISSSKGVFVLIGAYIAFEKFPNVLQVVGGTVTILGVILITLGKRIRISKT